MTLTALEQLDIDLEKSPLCQSLRYAPHPAEIALHLTCGCVMLCCIPCRDQSLRTVHEWEQLQCPLCKYIFVDPSWGSMVISERPL